MTDSNTPATAHRVTWFAPDRPVEGTVYVRPESAGGHAVQWVKASASIGANACVELAADGAMIALRDSKHPHVHLRYTHAEISAFLLGVKQGEFDHLVSDRTTQV